jgi:peptide/nickel transport system permease protein
VSAEIAAPPRIAPPIAGRKRGWLKHRSLVIGGGLLALIVLVAILAPLISPHDPYAQNLARRVVPPFWYPKGDWAHPLGTDNLGRDYLARTLYGARISLLIGGAVALLSGLIGTALGVAAGIRAAGSTSS